MTADCAFDGINAGDPGGGLNKELIPSLQEGSDYASPYQGCLQLACWTGASWGGHWNLFDDGLDACLSQIAFLDPRCPRCWIAIVIEVDVRVEISAGVVALEGNLLGFHTKDANVQAQQLYERAIALDPQYAEAQAEAAEVLRINPKFSLAVHKQRAPIKDPAGLERHIAALRRAGLK